MAARMLKLLPVAVLIATVSADCAGSECPAEADDSVSLLAHRASGSSTGRRRKCSMETGATTKLEPVGATPPDFSMLMVDGDVEVSLIVGSPSKVEVHVDSGLQSYIDASVSDEGGLSIKFSAPCDDIDEDPKVFVTTPSLPTTISASDDAQVQFPKWPYSTRDDGTYASVESMSLTASSDAKIQLKKVEVTGTLDITTSSDAQVDTQWTVSPTTKITAKGDSQVQGGSTTTLEVDIRGESQVKYTVTGTASGSVTDDSELKFKVKGGGAVPDYSAVTKDSSSEIKIDYD